MEGKEEIQHEVDEGMVDSQQEVKSDTFKKPQLCLIGPRKSKGAKVRVVDSQTESKTKEENQDPVEIPNIISPVNEPAAEPAEADNEPSKLSTEPEHRTSKPKKGTPAQKLKETPIPYLEPKWGGIPADYYSLDVIKSGTVLEPVDLSTKSHIVFGRQTNCDVQMAHPTVSRHHAVLQYSRGTDEKPQGFYLYDLGSTHGTFLNKSRVRPEIFIRIKVGHQIKLGGSTRLYLLQGPSDDMEEESNLTVTELKAKRQLELQARELAELSRKQKEEEEQKKREEEGVDWGMGDDADEETDLSENPYAATTNEELYIDDPKKTLRGWFEREGHELDYDVEEKGPGQFLCRVEVPVEGARGGCMVAEALIKGKKKEAVAQCALEACRLLDRLGLLRQATHESRKRKAKNWEDEDFYDSDDDTFLDRTGVVEKKRHHRMKQAGKGDDHVETYQSLSEKHSDILKTLQSTQVQLKKAQADLAAAKTKGAADEEGDTLESFMSNLSSVGCADKKLVSKLKVELTALSKEEAQLRKLVNIARPASLPELVAPVPATAAQDTNALKNKLMLAARKKASEKHKILAGTSVSEDSKCEDEDMEEKEEEPKEQVNRKEQVHQRNKDKQNPDQQMPKVKPSSEHHITIGPAKPAFIQHPSTSTKSDENEETKTASEVQQEHIPGKTEKIDGNIEGEDEEVDEDDDDERSLKEAEKRKKRNRRRLLQRNEKALERTKTQFDTSDPNYSVWVPPEGQSGDGKTKLNDKLGY